MSEYRTLWIEAKPERTERKRVLGEGTVEKPDNYQVDAQLLAEKIEHACNAAGEDGYEVISILPIIRGRDYMQSLAYSVTDGVILTARRKPT